MIISFCMVFALVIQSSCFTLTGLEENDVKRAHDVDAEVDSLFTSLSPKSTPLFVCDPEMGGIEWLLPSSMSCELQPKDSDDTKLVGITVYWTDITHQEVTGFECTGLTTETHGFRNTWPWSREGWTILNQTTTVSNITAEQCNDMVQQKIAPNGKKLNRVTEMVFETGFIVNTTEIIYFYARGYKEVKTNFRIQQLVLGISEIDKSIQTTAAIITTCFSNSSSCKTLTGILVWTGANFKVCRLVEGEQSNCLMRTSENMTILSCPDLKLSLHNVTSVPLCELTFGYSMGIFFLFNDEVVSNGIMATPEKVKGLITRPRNRREASAVSLHPFEAEIKANMNFLYDTIRNGTVEAIYSVEQKVCETNKAQLDMLNAISQSGHPSITTRMIYKDDLSYRAAFSGDVLTIYKCIEIVEYMFTDRKECMFEWPVSYVFNHKVSNGFMTPTTHTIVSTATARSTRNQFYCPKFYFKTPHYIVLLANTEAKKVNLPTLPQLNDVHERIELLPPLSFVPTGNLEANSDDVGTVFHLLRELQTKNEIVTNTTEVEIHRINKTGGFVSGLLGFFGGVFGGLIGLFATVVSFIFSFFLPILYWAAGIFIVVLLAITGLWKLPFKTCRRYKKHTRKFFGIRKEKKRKAPANQLQYLPSAPYSPYYYAPRN